MVGMVYAIFSNFLGSQMEINCEEQQMEQLWRITHYTGSAGLESTPHPAPGDKTIIRTYRKAGTVMNERHHNIMLRYVSLFSQPGDKGRGETCNSVPGALGVN